MWKKIISNENCLHGLYCHKKNGLENYVTENMILYCGKFELNGLSDVLSMDVFLSFQGLLHVSIHVNLHVCTRSIF